MSKLTDKEKLEKLKQELGSRKRFMNLSMRPEKRYRTPKD